VEPIAEHTQLLCFLEAHVHTQLLCFLEAHVRFSCEYTYPCNTASIIYTKQCSLSVGQLLNHFQSTAQSVGNSYSSIQNLLFPKAYPDTCTTIFSTTLFCCTINYFSNLPSCNLNLCMCDCKLSRECAYFSLVYVEVLF